MYLARRQTERLGGYTSLFHSDPASCRRSHQTEAHKQQECHDLAELLLVHELLHRMPSKAARQPRRGASKVGKTVFPANEAKNNVAYYLILQYRAGRACQAPRMGCGPGSEGFKPTSGVVGALLLPVRAGAAGLLYGW